MNGKLPPYKIEKLKKLKALFDDPTYGKNVSTKAKKFMAVLETLYPEIGYEPEEVKVEIPEWEKAKELAIKKGYQAELAGITKPESTYGTLVEKGLLPEFRDKTFMGKVGESLKFPLLKLMTLLMTPERTFGAMLAETGKRAGVGEKYLPGYKPELPTEVKFAPPKFRKWEDIKAVLKVGGKELIRPIVDIPRKPGEPEYIGMASALKELLPKTPVTKEFEFAKEWGAKEAPWYKKAVAGLAGSPADILGLYFDILMPPLAYLSVGARGAKTGIALSDDLTIKGGKVLLPKGTPIVLTKLGKKVVEEGTKKTLPKVLNFVSKIIKGKPLTKTAKLLKEVPEEILKKGVKIKVTEGVLRNTVKNMPYDEAAKLIDFGGLKWGGKTIIPGYKITKALKPLIAKIEQVPLVNTIERMFWTRKGFPEAMRPLRTIVKTQMRHRYEEGARLIQDIFKGLSKSEIDNVGKYIWMNSDIALYTAKGKKIPTKLLSQLDEITGKLNPKQVVAATRYQDDFVKKFLANFEKELKIQYPELAKYYPARYMYEPSGWARRVIGPETGAFQKQKRLFYLQAQKLVKEGKIRPKDIISASMQRTFEHTTQSGRAMMLQEIKRFASPVKKVGFTSVKGIPELKGWHMADEFIEPLLKVEKAFYGDEGFRWTMKVIDKGLDIWRKTALFTPGYHWRNFWTDTISGSMEYGPKFLKPRYWKEALDIQRRRHVPIKSLAGMYGDEAYDLFAKTGVKSGGWYAEEAGKGVYRGIWSSRNTPFALSRRAGIFREDLGRIVCALIEKESGSSIESIVEQVGKVFFHYWDVTQFERQFGRRFLNPFWTWYSKNIRRQVELLFTRPGAYATIPKVATFVEGMSKMPEGYQEYKPEYFSDLFVTMTPFRTQEGVPLALNPNFAFQDWSRLSLKDFASSLNPMLKIPIELITGKEIFFNTPIREGKYVEAPSQLSWCKKLPDDLISNFGMKVKRDGKLYMTEPAIYIWRQNPLFYNLMRLYPATEKPKTPYDWLSIFAGIKFFPYEEDKAKRQYYQEFIDEINKRIAAEETEEYKIPDINEIEYAYRQIYGEEIGKKYDIEKIKLIKALLALRGGKKVSGAMTALKLVEEPYKEEMLKTKGKTIGELKAMLESLGIKPTMEEVKTTLSE